MVTNRYHSGGIGAEGPPTGERVRQNQANRRRWTLLCVGVLIGAHAWPPSVLGDEERVPAPASTATASPAQSSQVAETEVQPQPEADGAADSSAETPTDVALPSMNELLDQAVPTRQPPTALERQDPQSPSPPEVPERPERDQVALVAKRLAPAIRGCALGASGRADLLVVLQADGHVTQVRVGNPPFAGTPSGQCMEGVMRRTRFPAFRLPLFRIQVPYVLQ